MSEDVPSAPVDSFDFVTAVKVLRYTDTMKIKEICELLGYSKHNNTRDLGNFLADKSNDMDTKKVRFRAAYLAALRPRAAEAMAHFISSDKDTRLQLLDEIKPLQTVDRKIETYRKSVRPIDWSKLGLRALDERDPHVCPICCYPFVNRRASRLHVQTKHGSRGARSADEVMSSFLSPLERPLPLGHDFLDNVAVNNPNALPLDDYLKFAWRESHTHRTFYTSSLNPVVVVDVIQSLFTRLNNLEGGTLVDLQLEMIGLVPQPDSTWVAKLVQGYFELGPRYDGVDRSNSLLKELGVRMSRTSSKAWCLDKNFEALDLLDHAFNELNRDRQRAGRGAAATVFSLTDSQHVVRVDASCTVVDSSHKTFPWPRHIQLLDQHLAEFTDKAMFCVPQAGCWARQRDKLIATSTYEPGCVWVEVMARVDQELLHDHLLQQTSLDPVDEAKGILTAVKDACGTLSHSGLAHGDLKPQNIFVQQNTNGWTATLIDWTSLCAKDEVPLMSTPGYYIRSSDTGAKHDEYALKVIEAQLFVWAALQSTDAAKIDEWYHSLWQRATAAKEESNPDHDALRGSNSGHPLMPASTVLRAKVLLLERTELSWSVGEPKPPRPAEPTYAAFVKKDFPRYVSPHYFEQVEEMVAELRCIVDRTGEGIDVSKDLEDFLKRFASAEPSLNAVADEMKLAIPDRPPLLAAFLERVKTVLHDRNIAASRCLSLLKAATLDDDTGENLLDCYVRGVISNRPLFSSYVTASSSGSTSRDKSPRVSAVQRDTLRSFYLAVASATDTHFDRADEWVARCLTHVSRKRQDGVSITLQTLVDFLNEMEHPNVYELHDAASINGDDDLSTFIVMYQLPPQFVSGTSSVTWRFGRLMSRGSTLPTPHDSTIGDSDWIWSSDVATIRDAVPVPGDASFISEEAENAWGVERSWVATCLQPKCVDVDLKAEKMWQVVRQASRPSSTFANEPALTTFKMCNSGSYYKLHVKASASEQRPLLAFEHVESFTTPSSEAIELKTMWDYVARLAGATHLRLIDVVVQEATKDDLETLVHACGALTGCQRIFIHARTLSLQTQIPSQASSAGPQWAQINFNKRSTTERDYLYARCFENLTDETPKERFFVAEKACMIPEEAMRAILGTHCKRVDVTVRRNFNKTPVVFFVKVLNLKRTPKSVGSGFIYKDYLYTSLHVVQDADGTVIPYVVVQFFTADSRYFKVFWTKAGFTADPVSDTCRVQINHGGQREAILAEARAVGNAILDGIPTLRKETPGATHVMMGFPLDDESLHVVGSKLVESEDATKQKHLGFSCDGFSGALCLDLEQTLGPAKTFNFKQQSPLLIHHGLFGAHPTGARPAAHTNVPDGEVPLARSIVPTTMATQPTP